MTTPLDELYVTDAAQDPHEPVWESDANIAEMTSAEDPSDMYEEPPAIRTAFGFLEYLNEVQETIQEFVSGAEVLPSRPTPIDPIRTREIGSDKWRPTNKQVTDDGAIQLVTESRFRRAVQLINYGPNPCYITNITPGSNDVPGKNFATLLVSSSTFWAPLCIETRDDIWAICASTQTARVEVIEEFDLEQ